MMTTADTFEQQEKISDAEIQTNPSQWNWQPMPHSIMTKETSWIEYVPSFKAIIAVSLNHVYRFFSDRLPLMISPTLPTNCMVHSFVIDPFNPDCFYLATNEGLYVKEGRDREWRISFTHANEEMRNCLSIQVVDQYIFLGTQSGVFVSRRGSESWRKMDGGLGHLEIFKIIDDQNNIWLMTRNQVFRFDFNKNQLQKLFELSGRTEAGETDEEEIEVKTIYDWLFLPSGEVLLATSKGFYLSQDRGVTWKQVLKHFPADLEITGMVDLSSSLLRLSSLIVSTNKGAFFLTEKESVWLYQGLTTSQIYCLASDGDEKVYAGTDQGIFTLSVKKTLPVLEESVVRDQGAMLGDQKTINELFVNEPTINQVHEWAVAFADVSNQKIEGWRRKARKRAWLPKLSMGADGSKNRTTSDSVYGSYSGGGQSYIGPDDKTFDDDFGWDVDLTWELGDLIYTSEETSIDSRAKMMVELREEILDQVTRLYFERKRLIIALNTGQLREITSATDARLRIEELTALIDAMTDGKFSRQE